MTNLEEIASLSVQDSDLLEEMAKRLRAIDWEISACGYSGHKQRKSAEELAPKVIKAMANYI